ncbi:unnamed protein product [Onchocerca flexuosa]|uniref:Uncharacterized protein n=1 Tax=Onchocerca flexuosa TaxID=387005 RepID=A0A183HXC9_9BILA|nr:unnamed protein product [Onchocerca flexuosa]
MKMIENAVMIMMIRERLLIRLFPIILVFGN